MLHKNLLAGLIFLVMLVFFQHGVNAQTPVPMASQPSLTYIEDFADIANWTNGFAAGIGANRYGSVAVNSTGTIPSATRITAATATFVTGSSGGVQRGTGNIQLLSTGATDNTSSAAFDLFLDFTGMNAGTISFNAATVFNSTGNRNATLRLYATTNNTNWTEITGTNFPYTATNNVAGAATISNISLPASFNNAATARLRFYFHNGTGGTTGSRPKISIDNINIVAIDPNASPTVTSNSATATVGVPFSYFITANSAPTSYNATGIAAYGLTVNTTTGQISGTPTSAVAAAAIPIEATNAIGTGTGTLTLTINPGIQVISFGPLSAVTYGVAPFTLTATGGASGNPVTFSSDNTSVASISGNTITINGGGIANITASQAGNADYNAALDVIQSITVNPASQTITFGSLSPVLTTDPPFTLNATGGASGNPITYISSNSSVASISGNVVTIGSQGSTIITASQAGNANFLAATDVSQTLIVNLPGLISQTITFNPLPPATYGDGPITLTASGGGSGNPVVYVSSNTAVATVSGNQLTIFAPGTTTVTASQAGNSNYEPALDVSQMQLINVKPLTAPSATADNKVYDGNTNATLSNLTLSGVVGSDTVSTTGGGTFASPNAGNNISVTANLALSGPQAAYYSITQPSGLTANITKASQSIVFAAIPPKTYTSLPFTLTATGGGSTSPVTFVSDNASVAIISGNTVTITGVGTANITASQTGDANYEPALDVVQILTVGQATQFINFAAIPAQIIGASPLTLPLNASSNLPITYMSSNPNVATVSGNTLTILGVGTSDITASQAGDVNFLPATNVVRTLTVTYPLLAAWDFFGQNTIATFPATTFNSNLVSASGSNLITRGPAAAASAGGNSFRTTGFQNNGIATTNQDYFQTTLQAQPGHSISLSSINAVFAGTTSFAAAPGVTSQFAYSVGDTNFVLIDNPFVTVGTPANSPLIDLTSIPALQNVHASQVVTIRYYASGQTVTGGWGFISAAAGTNGLAFGGSTTICVPVNASSTITICNNDLPYSWNGQTFTAAGTYTHTAISSIGCDSVHTLTLVVNSCAASTLNLTCLIQGYYSGSAMQPCLFNQGASLNSNDCDTVTVELRNAVDPTIIVDSAKVVLNVNGMATCTFSSTLTGNYYIVVKHRSAIQTWSADSVSFASPTVNYNFTTAATQAYGANMIEVASGVWAFYSGDVVSDENMDLLDIAFIEIDINAFEFGYKTSDVNGDGNVDLLDAAPVETNASNFIFSNHP